MNIKKIGTKNFHSLNDVTIELKPLTILIGQNSSGKSSFLRMFPLLKQSFQPRIRGALSLLGDYVDFGDFEDVLNKNNTEHENSFSLNFNGDFRLKNSIYEPIRLGGGKDEKINFDLQIQISNFKEQDYLYISQLDLSYGDHKASFSIDIKNEKFLKFNIDDISYISELKKDFHVSYSSFHHIPCFPTIYYISDDMFTDSVGNILLLNVLKKILKTDNKQNITMNEDIYYRKNNEIIERVSDELFTG